MIPFLYETLRSWNGEYFLLDHHQNRLDASAKKVGFPKTDLKNLLPEPTTNADLRVKIELYPDGSTQVQTLELPLWHGSFLYPEIWPLKKVQGQRQNTTLKHGNTAWQHQELKVARKEGFGEIMMINSEGWVREGAISNIFFIENKTTLISPKSSVLPGIGLQLIFEAAQKLGLSTQRRDIHQSELKNLSEPFLCNSVRGLVLTQENPPTLIKDLVSAITLDEAA